MYSKKKFLYFIFFLIILGLSFLAGLKYSSWKNIEINEKNKVENKEEKNNKFEKKDLNFSILNDLNEILEEKFIDTREDKSKKITDNDKVYGAATGFVETLGDPYTSYFPPEDSKLFNEDIEGEFYGVGMEVGNRDGYLTVINPLPGSPAQKAGIRAKDLILKIDDKKTLKMPVYEAVKMIRGEKGTKVKLTLLRAGKLKPIEVEIKRDKIEIPVGNAFLHNGVFVVKIYSFSKESSKWFFKTIVNDFRKAKTNKLIIDLRNNPGGLLNAAVFIAGMFLPQDEVIVTEDHQGNGETEVFKSGDGHLFPTKTTNIFKNLKLGILINGGSASASEILAGSLMNHKKAILFGEKSFGKGTVQELVPIKEGGFLKVTVAKFILPNGDWISYKGIKPDVEIKMSDEEYKKMYDKGSYSKYVDSQLDKTIKYMKKFKSQKSFENEIEKFAKKRNEEKEKKEENDLDEAQKYLNKN